LDSSFLQVNIIFNLRTTELFIVCPRDYEAQLSRFLADYVRTKMSIDLVISEDMSGSADGLRAVSDRIRGDFFCVGSDFISQCTLGEMANLHRINSSDLTMMLATTANDVKRDEVDQEFIAINNSGRIFMKTPLLGIDENLEIPKEVVARTNDLSLRSDLVDLGIYVMSRWVMEYLNENTRISNVRTELVPYMIQRQFQPASYLLKNMPALAHRTRPLKKLESWLASQVDLAHHSKTLMYGDPQVSELCDALSQSGFDERATVRETGSGSPLNHSSGNATELSEYSDDMLRCFGLVYEVCPSGANGAAGSVSGGGGGGAPGGGGGGASAGTVSGTQQPLLLSRITNIQTYLNVNK
jgi:hypothetical protein